MTIKKIDDEFFEQLDNKVSDIHKVIDALIVEAVQGSSVSSRFKKIERRNAYLRSHINRLHSYI